MNMLIILATRVLHFKASRRKLVVILHLKMKWDNGAMMATPAVLVSFDTQRRASAQSRVSFLQLLQLTRERSRGLRFLFFFFLFCTASCQQLCEFCLCCEAFWKDFVIAELSMHFWPFFVFVMSVWTFKQWFLRPRTCFSHLTAHWYSPGDRKPSHRLCIPRNESCYFQWPWRTVSLVSRRFRNVNFPATKLTSTGCPILSRAWKVVIRGPRTNDPPQNIPPYAVNRPRIFDCFRHFVGIVRFLSILTCTFSVTKIENW